MPTDLDLLQGPWHIATLELNGATLPTHAATITLTADQFTTAGMGASYTGRLELFPADTPKRLTMHFQSGPEAGNTNHGIYEIDTDHWRLCLNTDGGPAPTSFTSSKTHALETLKRPTTLEPPTNIQPIQELQGQWDMLTCLRSGEPLPKSFAKSGRRTIDGTQTTLHFGTMLFSQGHLSADGPNQLRLDQSDGTQLGIYELDNNSLRTCLAAPNAPRPTEYKSTKSGGETLSTWRKRP